MLTAWRLKPVELNAHCETNVENKRMQYRLDWPT